MSQPHHGKAWCFPIPGMRRLNVREDTESAPTQAISLYARVVNDGAEAA